MATSLICIINDASEAPERVHEIVVRYNHNTPRLVPPSIPPTWRQARGLINPNDGLIEGESSSIIKILTVAEPGLHLFPNDYS